MKRQALTVIICCFLSAAELRGTSQQKRVYRSSGAQAPPLPGKSCWHSTTCSDRASPPLKHQTTQSLSQRGAFPYGISNNMGWEANAVIPVMRIRGKSTAPLDNNNGKSF